MKILFFLIFSSVFSGILSSCHKDAKHPILLHYPGFTEFPLPHFNPIKRTWEVQVPDLVGAFNPGFLPYKNSFLLMPRFYGIQGARHKSYLAATRLNSHFAHEGKVQVLKPQVNGKDFDFIEDPRPFYFKDELWVAVSGTSDSVMNRTQQMFLSKLNVDENENFHTGPFLHMKASHKIIKNLAPFEYNGELYFVYSMTPHRIIKVDTQTGHVSEIAKTEGFTWDYGKPRGGSTVVPFGEDEFLEIFHSSKEYSLPNGSSIRIYVMGAYTFENKFPFRVTRYTEKPICDETYYDERNQHMIIFPTGVYVRGDSVFVSFGKNDDSMFISEIDRDALVNGMTVIPL